MNILKWLLRYLDRGFILCLIAMWLMWKMGDGFTVQHSSLVLAIVGYFVRDYKIKTNGNQ
jgi:hypothetical protein